jgi:hypothetical protein
MSAFEHVTALLSFVYALALTHLLARVAELIVARERVKFSGLLALGMVNAVLLVFVNWLSLWDLRSVTSWDLASIAIQFLFAISVYVICALVGPKSPEEGQIDLEDFFWRQRSYFYGAIIACLLLALLANLDFLKTTHNEWAGNFDGKDYPLTGDPDADTRAYAKVNDYNLTFTQKKGGKVTVTGKIAMSADGKSRTVTTWSTNHKGKKVKNVAVYDKA